MSTRVVVRGQTYIANADALKEQRLRQVHRQHLPKDRRGELMTGPRSPSAAIPVGSKHSPFRAGVGWHCPVDHVNYRIVASLEATGGWATAKFWQERWHLTHGGVLQLARAGLLDAAMLECSQVRRFRCRDEAAVLQSDTVLRAALKRRQAAQDARSGDAQGTRGVAPGARQGSSQTRPAVSAPRRVNGRWVHD